MPNGMWLVSYLTLWLMLLVVSGLLVAVLRQLQALHTHWVTNDPEWGLPLGAPAPALPGEDLYGRPVSLAASRGKKTLLFFLSPGCKSCRTAMWWVPALIHQEGVELVLVVSDKPVRAQVFLANHHRERAFPEVRVVVDPNRTVTDQYKVNAVPYAVVVDEDGRIGAKGTTPAESETGALLRQAERLRQRRRAEEEGRALPLLPPEPEPVATEAAA